MLISVASWLKIDSPFGSTVILDVIVFMFLIGVILCLVMFGSYLVPVRECSLFAQSARLDPLTATAKTVVFLPTGTGNCGAP